MEKIFNITLPNIDNEINFFDYFETIFEESDNAFYEGLKTYHHDEEDFNHDYKFCVSCNEGEANEWWFQLIYVPLSLSNTNKEQVASFCGIDKEDITCFDIGCYGNSVTLASHKIIKDDDMTDDAFEDLKMVTLNKIAMCLDNINSFKGFYLDKAINLMGTSGWDVISHACFDTKLF